MIETRPVDSVLGSGQLAICKKKSRVERDCLIEQLHGFEKICLTAEAIIERLLDQRGSANIKIVGGQIAGWLLLDGHLFAS